MNIRLVQKYQDIANRHVQAIPSGKLEHDKAWGKKVFGVTMQIELSSLVCDSIVQYQQDLQKLTGNALLISPKKSLHITFNHIISWDQGSVSKNRTLWEHYAKDILSSFQSQNKRHKAFDIKWHSLIATKGGIILTAIDDHDEMEVLRNSLYQALPSLPIQPRLISIIHTTIARYKNIQKKLTGIHEYINHAVVPVDMHVDQIRILLETVYPSLEVEEVGRIKLV